MDQANATPGSAAAAAASQGIERLASRALFAPSVDIMESTDAILVRADLPGVAPGDVDITLEKNTLTLKARVGASAPAGHQLAYSEYEDGDYERSFHVTESIDSDAIAAKVDNGVLTVTLPKRQPRTRRIAIETPS